MPYEIDRVLPGDARTQAAVDALLQAEGIRRDPHLDYTCALYDEDGCVVGTGSCFASTLRCLAVDSGHQGEGLLNQIVTHLMQVQAERGNTHVFVYTKPAAARFLGDLGFYEIARVPGEVVFMENRRTGFSGYRAALERQRVPGARSAAVVMNANPFTLGHRHLVERAAGESDALHLFLLSQEAGPIPHAVRRRLVEEGVADLPNVVLHETGPYMISAATFPSYFLKSSDDAIRVQAALDLAVFVRIAKTLGIRRRYVGEERASHVTALYNEIMARELPKAGLACVIVPRLKADGRVISASDVRQAIHDDRMELIRDWVPPSTFRYFTAPEAEPVRQAIRRTRDVLHH